MTQLFAIGFNSARLWPSVLALVILAVGMAVVMVGRMFDVSRSKLIAKVTTVVGGLLVFFGAYGLYSELPLLFKLRAQIWYIVLVLIPVVLIGGAAYLAFRWWQYRSKHKGDAGGKNADGFYTLSQNG